MPRRDSFLLRTDPEVLDALRRWARDELRSINGQLEFLLRRALRDAGRLGAGNGDDEHGRAGNGAPGRSGSADDSTGR